MQAGQRAIAYLRVSVVGDRAKRGRLESPGEQRAAIDAWCAQRGIKVVLEIRDLNRSGGTLTRPGLADALEQVRTGVANGIVVARSDRASRRTVDGLGLIDKLEGLGGWIAAADGTIDTTDRVSRMATTMMLAVGQHELERFQEQSAQTH
jgi:DNA invertase Pin-like site-specific DNA recombinase